MKTLHPNTQALLDTFEQRNLAPNCKFSVDQLRARFALFAKELAAELDGPELTRCLTKLREAKDCAVLARIVMGD